MGGRKTYLFIDDSRVSRMKIRQVVLQKRPDWELVEAASGEEAIEKVTSIVPDVVSLDINMPGMGGLAAAEHLRQRFPQAKIFFLSGNVQDSMRQRAAGLGVGFVEKPITEAAIVTIVGSVDV